MLIQLASLLFLANLPLSRGQMTDRDEASDTIQAMSPHGAIVPTFKKYSTRQFKQKVSFGWSIIKSKHGLDNQDNYTTTRTQAEFLPLTLHFPRISIEKDASQLLGQLDTPPPRQLFLESRHKKNPVACLHYR